METYPTSSAPLSNFIVQLWECDTHGCIETCRHDNVYYPFVMGEANKYIQCGIKQKNILTYYENVLMKQNTAQIFTSFNNWDGIQMLVHSILDEQVLVEWQLHTVHDM